jgi:general secretion pathway protein B
VSLILDALNRARQDTDKVPSLATQHYVDDVVNEGRGRHYLPWLALLVALVIIGWLLLDRETEPLSPSMPQAAVSASPQQQAPTRAEDTAIARGSVPEPVAPAQIKPVPAPPVTARVPRVIESAPVTAAPPELNDPAVAELYQQRQAPQTAAKNRSQPEQALQSSDTTQGKASPTSSVNKTLVKAVQEPGLANAAGSDQDEEPIDIEKMILKAREDLENANLEEHSVPLLSSLSQQVKDSIPTIFYERHDYSDNPAQSSVVLNGKSVKAGGSPSAGLKVEEILPDSTVLNYRGTAFRLRALNSWVNL